MLWWLFGPYTQGQIVNSEYASVLAENIKNCLQTDECFCFFHREKIISIIIITVKWQGAFSLSWNHFERRLFVPLCCRIQNEKYKVLLSFKIYILHFKRYNFIVSFLYHFDCFQFKSNSIIHDCFDRFFFYS